MIICSLFDSCLVSFLHIMAMDGITGIEPFIVTWFNRMDFILLIAFTNCLFFYTLLISRPNIKKNPRKVFSTFIGIDIITVLILLMFPVNIISSNGHFSVDGFAVNLTYLLCGFYILTSIIIAFLNIKKMDKRYVPIFAITGIIIFLLIVFKINPYLTVVSITLTFVDYIMYHSIENPDMQMIEELTKAKNLSEKYNNDKSIFLFNMTQQIREPLSIIKNKTEKIFELEDVEEIKELVFSIKNAEQRISYVVNGVLDVSAIDSKKIKIVESQYKLDNLLKEVSIRAEIEASKKDLEFRTNFDSTLPSILYGDSIRMKQIINSLITNSIKYTKKGFIELNVNSIVRFDVCRLIISIKDSGRGINLDQVNNLFEKASKEEFDYSKIDDKEITLEVAKKMVNLIGGTITVQSEKNKGSEFTLIIDQKIANDNNRFSKMVEAYEQTTKQKKILFVNDKPDESNLFQKRLSSKYEITLSKNGQDCLNRVRNNEEFDLIVIREEMEKLDAHKVLIKLNQIKGFNIPVVLLSDEKEDKKKLLREGFKDVFSKSTPLNTLVKILDKNIAK